MCIRDSVQVVQKLAALVDLHLVVDVADVGVHGVGGDDEFVHHGVRDVYKRQAHGRVEVRSHLRRRAEEHRPRRRDHRHRARRSGARGRAALYTCLLYTS